METFVLLFLATVAAGAVNAVGGGGGLITFPLLLAVVSPVTADATSSLALLPGYASSTWVLRKQLAAVSRWFWLLLGPSLAGGLLGALLLSWSGNRSLLALVPWLVLVATLLIVVRPILTRWAGPRAPSREAPRADQPAPSRRQQVAAAAILFVVAIYGGFFGAGIGILIIGALGLVGLTDIQSVLPLKNALSFGLRGVAVAVFVVEGKVDWGYGLVMASGALIGGYLGGGMLHRTNPTLVRNGVIALGFVLAGYYFWKIYGSEIVSIGSD